MYKCTNGSTIGEFVTFHVENLYQNIRSAENVDEKILRES